MCCRFSFRRCEGVLPAHAVQGLCEDLRRHAVLVLQDQALLQRDRHGRPVFGAFTAGETDAVQPAADLSGEEEELKKVPLGQQDSLRRGIRLHLSRLPEDVHILVLPGVDVLPQKPQQLRKTSLGTRPWEAWMSARHEGQMRTGVKT